MKKLFIFCAALALTSLALQPAAAQVGRPVAGHYFGSEDLSRFALVDNLTDAAANRLVLTIAAPAPVALKTTVSLWPNPAQGTVQVALSEPLTAATELRIHDALGRVMRRQLVEAGATLVAVPLAELPRGLYTVSLAKASARLVIE